MNIPTPCAAPAASLLRATAREIVEGDPILLQDLQAHLEALRSQIGQVTNTTLRRLMAIEIGCIQTVLRGFVIVQAETLDREILADAERALAEVRAYAARGEFAEGLGYAKSALARVVQGLGGAPMPPLSPS